MAGKIKFLLEEEVQREGTAGGGQWEDWVVSKFSNNQTLNLVLLAFVTRLLPASLCLHLERELLHWLP